MNKIKVCFVCVQNSCRSQMAEYFGHKHNNGKFIFTSCGTKLAQSINPRAVKFIKEMYGDDISSYQPKTIDMIDEKPDYLISMGCDAVCPIFDKGYYENWELIDPVPLSDQEFKETVKKIENNVINLIKKLGD